jgi:hypothetical protein
MKNNCELCQRASPAGALCADCLQVIRRLAQSMPVARPAPPAATSRCQGQRLRPRLEAITSPFWLFAIAVKTVLTP